MNQGFLLDDVRYIILHKKTLDNHLYYNQILDITSASSLVLGTNQLMNVN